MILACPDCDRSWRYPCADCADSFVESHRVETGHQITVVDRRPSQMTSYAYQQTQPAWPKWMRGTA